MKLQLSLKHIVSNVLTIFIGCTISLGPPSYPYLYSKKDDIEVYPKIQDINNDTSILHLLINPFTLQFFRTHQDTQLFARITLKIVVENVINNLKEDSLTSIVYIGKRGNNELIHLEIPLKLLNNQKYKVIAQIEDLGRRKRQGILINYEKKLSSPSFIEIFSDSSKTPLFFNWIVQGKKIWVKCSGDTFRILYLPPDTLFPPPPFVIKEKEKMQPSFIELFNLACSDTLLTFTFEKNGLYVFKNSKDSESIFLLVVSPFFPYLTDFPEIIRPIRYITTSKEYESIIKSPNQKEEFENFFLKITNGNWDYARNLISLYYERVAIVNYNFTSYKEGYLTDRGMIYIIYGPPQIIQKTDTSEIWIYGMENSPVSTIFEFKKEAKDNIFNDLILLRNEASRFSWYRQIDNIRNAYFSKYSPF